MMYADRMNKVIILALAAIQFPTWYVVWIIKSISWMWWLQIMPRLNFKRKRDLDSSKTSHIYLTLIEVRQSMIENTPHFA
jgi:hypothetical protein